jgi:hypothetical protein
MHAKQFGFRPRHSTTLQLAHHTETVSRNFDKRRITGAVFLDVAKALITVYVKDLLYKITVLKFPSYLVKTISSYLDCRTFQTSLQPATSTCRGMRAGVAQSGLVSHVLFSLYVNDTPTPSRHVDLAQYADNTAVIAKPRSPSVFVCYQKAYHSRLERWLRDCLIAINVLNSTDVFYVIAARRIRKPGTVQFLGELIQWGEAAWCLGVTLDTRITWSAHVHQVRKKPPQRLAFLAPSFTGKWRVRQKR